jgi:CheY-like chemotaxis protein
MMQMAQGAPTDKLVVVIDDDPLALGAMNGLLRSWGCQVVATLSETAARSELARLGRRADLIICDYRLADGANGIDAIERLRAGSAIPALLVTADVTAECYEAARAGKFILLHKPVRPGVLREALQRANILPTPSKTD